MVEPTEYWELRRNPKANRMRPGMRLDHTHIHLAKPIIKNSYLIFINHSPLEGGHYARLCLI